ncbi:putative dienelactone hydrolase, alpha/Beta hydrolase [Helianthus debilis subsp. tardiflorus]
MSGPACCDNPPGVSSGEESGQIKKIASLNSYVSGNPDSKLAVLLISDIYGYEAPKLRIIADKVAAAGYYVVVPDMFFGDPFIPKSNLQDWIKIHPAKPAVEFAKPVIGALKEKGISNIGAAGFCWGAKAVVELAKDASIQAAALLHPTFVTLDDIKGTFPFKNVNRNPSVLEKDSCLTFQQSDVNKKVKLFVSEISKQSCVFCMVDMMFSEVKVPVAILGAEFDKESPPEVVKQFEAALQVKPEVDHFVKIYHGVSHGWTVRYRDEDITAGNVHRRPIRIFWIGLVSVFRRSIRPCKTRIVKHL